MEKFNFLVNFNLELNTLFLQNEVKVLSYKKIKESNLALFQENHDDLDVFIHQLNETLDILFNIFNYPYIETRTNQIIKRSELVNSYSEESFKKTICDASLWKENKGEMKPELVHSVEYHDTFVNYENIFIVYVFKRIINIVTELKEFNIQSSNSLSTFYGTKEASLSRLSIYQNIHDNKDEISKYLYLDGELNKNYDLLLKIHNKVKHLKLHKFYKKLKDYKFKLPVNLTNTILHDRRYNKVYRFFKSSILTLDSVENFDTLFFNYSVIRIADYLCDNVAKITPSLIIFEFNENKMLSLKKPLLFQMNRFNYELILKPNDNLILLNVSRGDEIMHDAIKVLYSYKGEFIEHFGYDSLIVCTNNNRSSSYNNIVELFYDDQKNKDVIFKNTFLSTQIIINLPNEEISKCPYCGQKELSKAGNNYHCLRCNGEFKKITINKKPCIWVKDLWRNF